MNLDDLIAEGEALSRPCFLLTTSPSPRLGGYWGGERRDRPNTVPAGTLLASRRHVITIDQSLLGELGLPSTAPLSLHVVTYRDRDRDETYWVTRDPSPQFADISCTGEALYAVAVQSFPPLEAVCLYGSRRVEEWLRTLGIARHQYDHVLGSPLGKQYADEFIRRAPFCCSNYNNADAIVGGWHMSWPEDDFFMPLEMRLVVITIRDAEPYFEVWVSEGVHNYSVRARIT